MLIIFNEFTYSIISRNKVIPFDLRAILFLLDTILLALLFYVIIRKKTIKYKNIVKLLSINFFFLILLIFIIEVIFGEWFFENNLNKLNIIKNKEYKIKLNGLYKFNEDHIIYKRDNYGFRGKYPKVSKINILTIGGSTTDQRFISEGYTYQDVIQKKFLENDKNIYIVNAGIDGQSTFGHLKNFDLWFSMIPTLKPDYFLFFIGINDFYIDAQSSYDEILFENNNKNIVQLINNYYQQYSALHYLMRNIEGNINSYKYNLRHGTSNRDGFQKIKWVNEGLNDNYEFILQQKLEEFQNRLIKIIDKVSKYDSKIIFVSQSERRKYYFEKGILFGNSEKLKLNGIFINGVDYYHMNRMYIDVINKISKENNIIFIDLEKELNFDIEKDFYDNAHFNHLGAYKIGEYLFLKLKNFY